MRHVPQIRCPRSPQWPSLRSPAPAPASVIKLSLTFPGVVSSNVASSRHHCHPSCDPRPQPSDAWSGRLSPPAFHLQAPHFAASPRSCPASRSGVPLLVCPRSLDRGSLDPAGTAPKVFRLPAPRLSAGSSLFFRLLFLTFPVRNAANVASSPPSPHPFWSTSAPHAHIDVIPQRCYPRTAESPNSPVIQAQTPLFPLLQRCYPAATQLRPAATRCYTPSPCHPVTHTLAPSCLYCPLATSWAS